jgi:hypothetical protein
VKIHLREIKNVSVRIDSQVVTRDGGIIASVDNVPCGAPRWFSDLVERVESLGITVSNRDGDVMF